MHTLHVIGLGVDHRDLSPTLSRRIEAADILVGGDRLLALYADHPGVKIAIKGPLEEIIERMKQALESHSRVVVLADGDPGFFGIGERLTTALGREAVVFHPNVTTLQCAAARLKIPWHDIKPVSLHGRKTMDPLLRALGRKDRIAVFTDPHFHPAKVADELLLRGIDTFRMYVFEDLGTPSEDITCLDLPDALNRGFSPLNFIILDRMKPVEVSLSLGLDDDLYVHQKGLITKREIRLTALSTLGIAPFHTVWDLGAGCGSVAIESSFLANEGKVFAVEKDPVRFELIKENIRRTGAYHVEAVHGDMPQCLDPLPDPDRIFIGGGTGKGTRVFKEAVKRLKPGGKIVLNLVLMGSLARATDYLKELKWAFWVTQVQVSRSTETLGDQRLEALNPVYILSATKPAP